MTRTPANSDANVTLDNSAANVTLDNSAADVSPASSTAHPTSARSAATWAPATSASACVPAVRRGTSRWAAAAVAAVLIGVSAAGTAVAAADKAGDTAGDKGTDASKVQTVGAATLAELVAEAEAAGTVPVIVHLDVPTSKARSKGAAKDKAKEKANGQGNAADSATDAAAAADAQRNDAVRAGALGALGKVTPKALRALPGAPFLSMHATAAELKKLGKAKGVLAIERDRVFDAAGTSSFGAANGIQLPTWWHLQQQGLTWTKANGYTGSGQAVVVIDSGVDKTHPWLAGKVVNEACFATNLNGTGACPGNVTSLYDSTPGGVAGSAMPPMLSASFAHGTHVAHSAAGAYGAAPGAGIIAIRAAHAEWDAKQGTYVARFNWSDIQNALWYVWGPLYYTPAAVNMSIGGGGSTGYCDAQLQGITNNINALLRDYGTATVISSGNDNYYNGVSMPACISSAITVGNTTRTSAAGVDAVLGYTPAGSNSGPQVDILATGTDICSAVPTALDVDGVKDGIDCSYYGTSMAAPQVAGAIAVMRQSRPTASVATILSALQRRGVAVSDDRNGLVRARLQLDSAVRYW